MITEQQRQDKWRLRAHIGIALVAACLLIGVVIYLFGILWQPVATIVVTAIIAFMLHGTVNYFVERGMSRLVATAISIFALLAVVVGVFALFVPALAEQIAALSNSAPAHLESSRAWIVQNLALIPVDNTLTYNLLDQANNWIQEQAGTILQAAAGGILSGAIGVGNAVLIFSIALICAFWVLVDLPTISREVMMLFNENQQKTIRVITGAFSTAVYGWMKATLICAFITGLANGLAYWILGVPYFALLGALCGALYIIPYIGPIIGTVLVVLAGLLVSPAIAIVALIANAVIGNVVANIVSPRLMRSSVSVHPALSLIVILVGGAIGGIVGMLFSIPIAAAVQGVFITFFEQRTGKVLATENGALFQKPKTKVVPTLRKPPKA